MRHPSIRPALPLAVGFLLLVGGPVRGADPSASPEPSGPPEDSSIQIWQDEPLPPDIPAGRSIEVGFTTWDTRRETLSQVAGADVRVLPATGHAEPTKSTTHSDWPGHIVTTITIPKGGLGRIEIGYPAQECHDDGTCIPIFMPFSWGGVGPPPQAPRSALVIATIHPIVGPVIAGQPFDVDVDVAPKVEWDATALALPKGVVAIASNVHGDLLTSVDLRFVNEGQYTGQMTIAEGGEANVVVGFAGTPSPDMIDRSIVRLRVTGGDAPATPAPSRGAGPPATAAPASGPDIPIVPIGIGAAGLLAIAFVLRRALADL